MPNSAAIVAPAANPIVPLRPVAGAGRRPHIRVASALAKAGIKRVEGRDAQAMCTSPAGPLPDTSVTY